MKIRLQSAFSFLGFSAFGTFLLCFILLPNCSPTNPSSEQPVENVVTNDSGTTDQGGTSEQNGTPEKGTNSGEVVKDPATGLYWQVEADSNRNVKGSIASCEKLELGGFSDWRLPTKLDYMGLLDNCPEEMKADPQKLGKCNSCADSKRCKALFPQDIKRSIGFKLWISTFRSKTNVWYFLINKGDFQSSPVTYLRGQFHRCVRP